MWTGKHLNSQPLSSELLLTQGDHDSESAAVVRKVEGLAGGLEVAAHRLRDPVLHQVEPGSGTRRQHHHHHRRGDPQLEQGPPIGGGGTDSHSYTSLG